MKTNGPALSPTTRDLLARLDAVASSLADPACEQTENELMAQHVRNVLTAGDSEPLFTEELLKMAAVELMHLAG